MAMDSHDKPDGNAASRLAHAKELHASADAARERSAELRQSAAQAKAVAEHLRSEGAKESENVFSQIRHESILEMAERHVTEANRHLEHQRALIEVLIRDKHDRMLVHARKILEILEKSQELAQTHLVLEREFHGDRS